MKYVRTPLVVSSELTTPVLPPVFEKDTDLVAYTLVLLGMVEQMNTDRVTLGKSIEVHNGK